MYRHRQLSILARGKGVTPQAVTNRRVLLTRLRVGPNVGPARHHGGFTLIELLVVIAIIGILSAIIVTTFRSARAKARDANRVSTLIEMAKAIELNADPLAPVAGCTGAHDDVTNCTVVGAINFVGIKDPSYTGSIICKGTGYFAGQCKYSITRLSEPAAGGATTQDYQICTYLENSYNNTIPQGLVNASSANPGSVFQGCS